MCRFFGFIVIFLLLLAPKVASAGLPRIPRVAKIAVLVGGGAYVAMKFPGPTAQVFAGASQVAHQGIPLAANAVSQTLPYAWPAAQSLLHGTLAAGKTFIAVAGIPHVAVVIGAGVVGFLVVKKIVRTIQARRAGGAAPRPTSSGPPLHGGGHLTPAGAH